MAEEKLNTEEDETPLQAKLGTIANQLGKLGLASALVAVIFGLGNMIVTKIIDDAPWFSSDVATKYGETDKSYTSYTLGQLVNVFITGITVIVIAVPEGLPLAVTLAFAFSVMKMKKENNLVRKLQSSETMGGANEICTDKTGTLTKNQMTVKEFYTME